MKQVKLQEFNFKDIESRADNPFDGKVCHLEAGQSSGNARVKCMEAAVKLFFSCCPVKELTVNIKYYTLQLFTTDSKTVENFNLEDVQQYSESKHRPNPSTSPYILY